MIDLRSARCRQVGGKNPRSDYVRLIPKADEILSYMQLHLTRLSGVDITQPLSPLQGSLANKRIATIARSR
jgi:hypothetical protein